MTDMIYCLVDPSGEVYARDGAESYAEVAEAYGLVEENCQRYRYDLLGRRLLEDRGTPFGGVAARAYFAQRLGTAARFMRFVADGHVPHQVLIKVLDAQIRRPYLDTCASIEHRLRHSQAAAGVRK